jgi:hypothetical protein
MRVCVCVCLCGVERERDNDCRVYTRLGGAVSTRSFGKRTRDPPSRGIIDEFLTSGIATNVQVHGGAAEHLFANRLGHTPDWNAVNLVVSCVCERMGTRDERQAKR